RRNLHLAAARPDPRKEPDMSAITLPFADRASRLTGSIIDSSTSLLAAQTHDIVRFAMGSPADEAVPLEEFRDIAGGRLDYSSFTYGATEGEPELLDELVSYLATTSEPTSLDRIIITAGGMQGLDLACKIFVDPGDLVIVESPTYTNGSATAASYGAELLEAPMDDNGLIVEALPELVEKAGRTPKAIYVIPNFQNPSGTTLSAARREHLLELAHQWNAVIIDDDPYGLLRFAGEELPSFQTLSPADPLLFSVDRKSTRLNSSHVKISYAVFCLKKNKAYSLYTQLHTPIGRCSLRYNINNDIVSDSETTVAPTPISIACECLSFRLVYIY